jgi:hypothetical protein
MKKGEIRYSTSEDWRMDWGDNWEYDFIGLISDDGKFYHKMLLTAGDHFVTKCPNPLITRNGVKLVDNPPDLLEKLCPDCFSFEDRMKMAIIKNA